MLQLLQRPLEFKKANNLWLMSTLTVGFIAMMALTSIIGFAFSSRREVVLIDYRLLSGNVRILQQGLIDAETGIRGFVLANRVEYLEPYFHGLQVIDERGPDLLPALDEYVARSGLAAEPHAVTSHISELRKIWLDVVALTENHEQSAALGVLEQRTQKRLMDELRDFIRAYLHDRIAKSSSADVRAGKEDQLRPAQTGLRVRTVRSGGAVTHGATRGGLRFGFEDHPEGWPHDLGVADGDAAGYRLQRVLDVRVKVLCGRVRDARRQNQREDDCGDRGDTALHDAPRAQDVRGPLICSRPVRGA